MKIKDFIEKAIEEKIVEVMKSPAMERVLGCESLAIARGAMGEFDGEILPDILRRAFNDIYHLGVSESPLKDLLEARAWISNKIANHNHSYEFSATKMGALEEERDRLEKLIEALTKTL